MENAMPSHGETSWLKSDDPFFPCNSIGERYLSECYKYVFVALLRQTRNNYGEALIRCSSLSTDGARFCVEGLGTRIGARVSLEGLSVEAARDLCQALPPDLHMSCVEGVTLAIVTQEAGLDHAGQFCQSVHREVQLGCHGRVVAAGKSYPKISLAVREKYCQSFTSGAVLTECVRRAQAVQ